MSTLTALQLQRELDIARLTMIGATERPKLACQWTIDPQSGRPVAVWTAVSAIAKPTMMPAPAFA